MGRANRIKELRKELGLSQAQVASFSRTKTWEVKLAENDIDIDKSKEKIKNYLEKERERVKKQELKLKKAIEEKKAFYKQFEVGKKYHIYTLKENAYKKNNEKTYSGSTWDRDCEFEFVKNEGIHHCFRSVQGGWTRTYTNAQLVDKHIREVQ
ncbi:MAG: hypothetical protein IJQ57_07275 [Synergistaceae bacterium]|nr:hypothetical protein [Synergistaceae bacterium]